MAKPEWGKKHECPNCTSRFYDLCKTPPLACPKCNYEFDPSVSLKARRSKVADEEDEDLEDGIAITNPKLRTEPDYNERETDDVIADADDFDDVDDDAPIDDDMLLDDDLTDDDADLSDVIDDDDLLHKDDEEGLKSKGIK